MGVSISNIILKYGIKVLLLPAILAISVLATSTWEPYQKEIPCNDDSIRLPNLGSTITSGQMYAVGLAIPLLLILYCEYLHYKKRELEQYYQSVFRKVVCFGAGFAFEYFTVCIGKLTTSSLSPNFVAVCGIDLDSLCQNTTQRYVSNYTCPNGELAAASSRLSFPSGHSAFSFYVAVFTLIYLRKRFEFEALFWRPLIQIGLVLLAWWISLSRIMDNKHHVIDVFVGIVIGVSIGIVNTVFIYSLDENKEADSDSSSKNKCSSQATAPEKRYLLQDED